MMVASGGQAAEWPRIAGQGTDWVRSLEEPRWPDVGAAGEPRWPDITNAVGRRFPSPWAFEIGARYWYSSGATKYARDGTDPSYTGPVSSLDWKQTEGHSGEIFARLDHRPSNLFVKGIAGAGILRGGVMNDQDYDALQHTISDTTSQVHGDNLRYATIDVGFSYELPRYGVRFGGFVGYHYWHEKMTAYGLLYNAAFHPGFTPPPGTVDPGYDTAVGAYEPTWHALRIGADARFKLDRRWSVSGEVALIPIARLHNDDSHLLRQSPTDLGPAPNILTNGWGWGGMAEAFVNYEITANLEAGLGVRYWGLSAYKGTVTRGPSFNYEYQLADFDQSRWGLLAQVKGKF